jgi:hypothetical protein
MCRPNVEKYTNSKLRESYANKGKDSGNDQSCKRYSSVLVDDPNVYNIDYTHQVNRPQFFKYYEGTRQEANDYDGREEDIRDARKMGSKKAGEADDKESTLYVNAYDDRTMHPGFDWQSPIRQIPPCTNRCDHRFVMPNGQQNGLQGTLLEEADKTRVGSIMPRFKTELIYD